MRLGRVVLIVGMLGTAGLTGCGDGGGGGSVTMAASPTTASADQGTTVTYSVAVQNVGSPGNVTLSLSGSELLSATADPAKVSYAFDPNPITNGLSTLTLAVGANVPPGDYTLTLTGQAAASSVTATLTLNVTSPSGDTTSLPAGGIVYVRIRRATVPISLPGTYFPTLKGQKLDPSFLDTLPEVNFIRDGFDAPGQLVWRRADGTQEIIYDCTGGDPSQEPGPPKDGDDTCVPLDPAVSYDGTKVAFAVYHGTYSISQTPDYRTQHNSEVGKLGGGTWAGIYIYDFNTGELTAWPNKAGIWDMSPVWLPNGQIMFTSTRANMYQHFTMQNGLTGVAQQLWIANADGSGAANVDPHDQQNALHPFVHSAGRVFYASEQYNEVRIYGHKKLMTAPNEWWMSSVDVRGGDFNAALRAHGYLVVGGVDQFGDTSKQYTITAPHFFGERSNGDMCFDLYYRGNNFGSGAILCWPAAGESLSPLGHEGAYPFGHPDGLYIAVAGDNGDDGSDGQGADKHVRDPAGMPDGQLMFSGAVGPHSACHWYVGGDDEMAKMINLTKLGDSCDFGIYISKDIPLADPANSTLVVDSPDWDEIMPKPVIAYQDIYGIPKPAEPPLSNSTDGSAIFASADMFVGNVTAAGGWQGPGDGAWCQFQGCALQAVPLTDIKAMRFWKAIPNDQAYSNQNPVYDNWGQKMELLGDVPVQSDGSFKAKLPADTPVLMAGVDANGNSIARHQNLMSLRPGEEQVCGGCHLHDPNNAVPVPSFEKTLAYSLPAVAPTIPAAEQGVLEWTKDVYPMLAQSCSSCHDGKSGSPQPSFAADEATLFRVLLNNDAPGFPLTDDGMTEAMPPWFTRYVNVYFARESLLYWKAAGSRLDGREDGGMYAGILDNDFEFGPAHPAHLNAQQLKILSDWIEAGAYRSTTP